MKTIDTRLREPSLLSCPDPAARSSSIDCSVKLENLKAKLLRKFIIEFADIKEKLLRQAVDEADALACSMGVPHLLLPILAEEKVQSVRKWSRTQEAIFQRSSFAFAA